MSLFLHQLAKCGQAITLETRVNSIINGLPKETFTTLSAVQGIIKTLSGVRIFDDTNTERDATHRICITFIAGITSEIWVKLGTRRIKILSVENCCEKDDTLILMCTERGEDVKKVNEA